MGEVYRARDSELEREVAIKVLPAAFADDEERVARLEREARLLASLNHPHIAAIHSLEAVDGNRFLVLEVVEGETLQERIARGPLPLDEAIEVSRQIAEALDAAHGKGVIHRDLKPPNIKLAPEGGGQGVGLRVGEAIHTGAIIVAIGVTHVHALHRNGRHPGNGALYEPRAGARKAR